MQQSVHLSNRVGDTIQLILDGNESNELYIRRTTIQYMLYYILLCAQFKFINDLIFR